MRREIRLGILVVSTVLLLIAAAGSASATINVTSPAAGANVSGVVTIRWTDTNGYNGPYNIYYYDPYTASYVLIVEGVTGQTYSWDTTGLNSSVSPTGAIYKYRVKVGNVTSGVYGVSGDFVIDNIPPSLSDIVSPAKNDAVLNGTVTVLVDVADNLFLRNVTLMNDTGVVDVNNTIQGTLSNGNTVRVILTYDTSTIPDGFDNLTATVYDMANNSLDSATVRVIIDHKPPIVTIVKPTANEWFNANITVKANVTDRNGVEEVYCVLENDTWNSGLIPMTKDPTTGNYTAVIDITNVADGNYRVRINASDIAQPDKNWNNETNVSIGIDKTPPELTNAFVRYPDGQNAAKNGNVIEINVTVTDAQSGVASVKADVSQINSTVGIIDLTNVAGTNYYNATVIVNTTDGKYNIQIVATDNAGNENATTVTVIVDKTPPEITILTPTSLSPIYINNGTTYWVNFTWTEENPMNYTVRVWNENGVINEISGNWPFSSQVNVSFTVYALDGKYNVTVEMYDNATNSNSATESYAVVVDNTPPTAPANLTATADKGAIILSWEAASDELSGVAYYKIYRGTQPGVYDKIYTTTETPFLDFNGTPGETYYYVVRAVDKAGNEGAPSNEANATFVKGEPVKIILTAPSQMTVGSSATITATVLDKYNNPVPGEDVSFGTTAGTITPAINTTNESGVATATLTAPDEVGIATVTVFVVNYPEVNNSTIVKFIPAGYSNATVYAYPEEIPADGVSNTTITVELLDNYGNFVPVSGVQVYLTTTAGTFENGEQKISGIVENGKYTVNLTAPTTPTTATVTANIAGIGERYTTVEFVAPAEFTIELVRGWQMVSAPLKSPITCDKQLIMYEYNASSGMYERATTFEPGKGYWVASATEQTITLRGSGMLENVTIELKKGWNLIGSIQHEVNLASIKNPDVYEYAYTWDTANKCYIVTQTIQPGKAYWIFAFNDTTITLEPLPPSPPS